MTGAPKTVEELAEFYRQGLMAVAEKWSAELTRAKELEAEVRRLTALCIRHGLVTAREFRFCPVCGGRFEVDVNNGSKTRRVFCRNSCRSRDYKARKAAAVAGEGG
jgi:hypothetical protein